MVIDEKRGFIFVHVPKTGGQSVSRALGGKTNSVPTHAPLSSYDRPKVFRFGFMRNPWDRMVSLYHFLCQKTFKHSDNFKQPEVRTAGFKRWLMEHEFFMKEDYRLPKGESWVVGGQGDLPPMQRRTQLFWLEGCDFIGCFENLKFDLQFACKKIGIKPGRLPVMNTTEHKHYQEYYDNETQAFIAEHFEPEIKQFGYSF